MKTRLFFVLLFIISTPYLLSICHAQCTAGHYLFGENDCRECPSGSFMDINEHGNKNCRDCKVIGNLRYEVQNPCNSTHDTVFRCAPNNFNSNGHEISCQECRVCEHVAQNCTSEEDAICCPHEEMIPKKLMNNSTCETESIFHKMYCCIAKTQPYSTTSTSSRNHSTGQGSISIVSKVKEDSFYMTTSSAQMNTSFGPESSTNSSYTDKETLSVGSIVAISVVCPLVVVALFVLVFLIRFLKKRQKNIREGNQSDKINVEEMQKLN